MLPKTSISNANTYQDIGAFWDEHDTTEFGEQTKVEFDVSIQSQRRYYSLDNHLSMKLRGIARDRGISEGTLLTAFSISISYLINEFHTMRRSGPCPRMIGPSAIVVSLSRAWPAPTNYTK